MERAHFQEMSDSLESLKRDKEECEKKMAEKEERIARERKELEVRFPHIT
jgi:hypothetical protein